MRQMVRGNGIMPGETQQQHSRETKHKKVRKEEKRGRASGRAEVEPLQAACSRLCGIVCQRGG